MKLPKYYVYIKKIGEDRRSKKSRKSRGDEEKDKMNIRK